MLTHFLHRNLALGGIRALCGIQCFHVGVELSGGGFQILGQRRQLGVGVAVGQCRNAFQRGHHRVGALEVGRELAVQIFGIVRHARGHGGIGLCISGQCLALAAQGDPVAFQRLERDGVGNQTLPAIAGHPWVDDGHRTIPDRNVVQQVVAGGTLGGTGVSVAAAGRQ
ncbi:hypothetical protein MUG10_07220 [Xanthomonas prunicola]|uniref:hypothetical protein n=1 Tax=Xanthomonas prunicola TaxID=2053930 RepID=UPI002078B47A|nr:hypothetical protein [Xanthomonas prunicola]USJ01934.1 hypothetical protein MUG10_07220 [Xanthomonas prunicola]